MPFLMRHAKFERSFTIYDNPYRGSKHGQLLKQHPLIISILESICCDIEGKVLKDILLIIERVTQAFVLYGRHFYKPNGLSRLRFKVVIILKYIIQNARISPPSFLNFNLEIILIKEDLHRKLGIFVFPIVSFR